MVQLVPITDNDIDLGTSSLEFKDAFFDGTVEADAITLNGTMLHLYLLLYQVQLLQVI